MTRAFSPTFRRRLGQLVRMLGSDKDGEVLAAVSALRRALSSEGASFHELADAIQAEKTVIVRTEVVYDIWQPPEPSHKGPPSWADLRDFERRDWLTAFLANLDIPDAVERQALMTFRAKCIATSDHRPNRQELDLFTRTMERAWRVGVRP